VLFARHGESVANVERVISNRDLPHGLTTTGRLQAQELADRMRGERIVALYTSPIPRARETAAIVGAGLGLAPIDADGLREPDRGVLEGRSDSEAWRRHDELSQRWVVDGDHASRADGGESLDDVVGRLRSLLLLLGDEYGGSDATLLCVTHGALLLTALPLVLDGPAATEGGQVVDHTATLEVEYTAGRWRAVGAPGRRPSPGPGVDESASSR
jgi:probable phosphoglycerate mutase